MKAERARIDGNTSNQKASVCDRPASDEALELSLPRMMPVSEIERDYSPESALGKVVGWIRGFLARPHPQLGRPGLVCPFVPGALKLDTIWLTELPNERPSFERLSAIVTAYRSVFVQMQPNSGPDAMNKVFLMAFPHFDAEGTRVIEEVQSTLKRYFVEMGLLVGEFHAANENPGLHNPDFRPLRSPVPMLAIRHLVESDLAFLNRELYSPQLRATYLRSYLYRLGGRLSQLKFNEAIDGLIAAEVSMACDRD